MKRESDKPAKGKHGGPGRGQGPHFSPGHRMWLAGRHTELRRELIKAGEATWRRRSSKLALDALRAELKEDYRRRGLDPDAVADIRTLRRMIMHGHRATNYFIELDAKRANGEPLDAFDRKILRQHRRSWLRRRRMTST